MIEEFPQTATEFEQEVVSNVIVVACVAVANIPVVANIALTIAVFKQSFIE